MCTIAPDAVMRVCFGSLTTLLTDHTLVELAPPHLTEHKTAGLHACVYMYKYSINCSDLVDCVGGMHIHTYTCAWLQGV